MLSDEIFSPCKRELERYKEQSIPLKKMIKEYDALYLRCKMDYESLFYFGEGNRLLILRADPSFASGIIFQCYEYENGELWLYWKDAEQCFDAYKEVSHMTVSEFQNARELQKLLNVRFPCKMRKLTDQQSEIIRKLSKEKLDSTVEPIMGYDGTMFYLRIFRQPSVDYEFWSEIPEEWKLFEDVTTMFAEISGAQPKIFYRAHVSYT